VAELKAVRPPRLSVILPVYNVEHYVAETLESLLTQDFTDLEIIAVDDGSTDSSASIVREHATRDPRIVLVQQPNGGLSAARNTGLAQARGEYIAFIDSDDLVEPHAFSLMIRTLDTTGSDFAVASYRHLRDGKLLQPGQWIREAHNHNRLQTRLDDFPQVLVNAIVCSKVFRRSFWDSTKLDFPVGVLYEDQEISTATYCLAGSFDVLSTYLLQWRIRETGTSITQQSDDPDNLRSRFASATRSLEVLSRYGRTRAHRIRAVQYLANNTFTLAHVAQGDLEYLEALRDGLTELWRTVSTADVRGEVSVTNKVLYWLVLTGRFAQAVRLAREGLLDLNRWDSSVEDGIVTGIWRAEPQALAEAPRWVTEMAERDTQLQTILTDFTWVSSTTVRLRGDAYVANVSLRGAEAHAQLSLVDPRAGVRFTIPSVSFTDPDASVRTRQQYADYSGSGFEATLDVAALHAWLAAQGRSDATMRLMVAVTNQGVYREGPVLKRATDSSTRAFAHRALGDAHTVVNPRWTDGSGLELSFARRPIVATSVETRGRELAVTFRARGRWTATDGLRLIAETLSAHDQDKDAQRAPTSVQAPVSATGDGLLRAVVTVPDLGTRRPSRWRVEATRGGASALMRLPDLSVVDAVGSDITVSSAPNLRMLVWEAMGVVEVVALAAQDDRLTVTALVPPPGRDGRLVCAIQRLDRRYESAPVRVAATDRSGTFTFTLDLTRTEREGWSSTAPQNGMYALRMSFLDDDGTPPGDFVVRLSPEMTSALPLSIAAARWEAHVRFFGQTLPGLDIAAPGTRERSAGAALRTLLDAYAADRPPLEETIYLQCLQGDQVSDTQLALADEISRNHPQIKVVWGVQSYAVAVPEGQERVLVGSAEYFHVLARSRYLCVNHEVSPEIEKREGQVLVQTYHGHPFKSMGVHRWTTQRARPAQIERALHARRSWDVLLSPSACATRLYRDNFPLDVDIAEVGHPRNDRLARATDEERDALRRHLGIAPSTTAVLYAPTYRDLASSNPWVSPIVTFIDPVELSARLGPDYTVLLRGHPANGRYDNAEHHADGVIDVTSYPEINDLIIATDVGVLDYSSLRFDYSVTKKPMVFFVPDKEQYFSFMPPLLDFDLTAPGPQPTTLEELVEAVHAVVADPTPWAQRYADFRRTFNHLDDGHATERLLEVMLAKARSLAPTTEASGDAP